jgi:AcrR family transcriptional regulator
LVSVSSDTRESTGARGKLSPGPGLPAAEVAAHQLARVHEALIEVVAESGYDGFKVRDVVRVAGVSSRAFYELFTDKEDCFLQSYDLIARRATRGLVAAHGDAGGPRERLRRSLDEMVDGIEREPGSARLALIDVYGAGEAASEHAWRAERVLVGMLTEAITRPPEGVVVPPMVLEGMAAGVAAVVRRRLLDGRVAQLGGLKNQLVDWACSYVDRAAGSLSQLDRKGLRPDRAFVPMTIESLDGEEPSQAAADRVRVLEAIAELTVADGYPALRIPRIRSAAGITRRRFDAVFDDAEDGYVTAVELRVEDALAEAAQAREAAEGWAGGVYRVIATLCDRIGADAFLAKACRTDDGPSGESAVRARQRLAAAIVDLIDDGTPALGSTLLSGEASADALWGLFYRHNVRDWVLRRRVAATLSYTVLAPAVGAPAALAAIQAEQRR